MDLTNLRESLETSAGQAHEAQRRMYDERLTSEFRLAALQMTNLYKKGLENTHSAFQAGYTQALRDTLELVCGSGSDTSTAASLQPLAQYLTDRIESLAPEQDAPEGSDLHTAPKSTFCAQHLDREPHVLFEEKAAAAPTMPSMTPRRHALPSETDTDAASEGVLSDSPPPHARKYRRSSKRHRHESSGPTA